MAIGFRGCAALAIVASLVAGSAEGATRRPANSINPANDKLAKMSPPERAGVLARAVGHWCIGTQTFLMGVETTGAAAGNAYWSLRCADGTAWAVQINLLAEIVAIDCDSFKENGGGKECFKKF
jgi:hypothetical protein